MATLKRIFEKQEWHLVILALLLALSNAAMTLYPHLFEGSFRGIGTVTWLWIGVLAAVLHQVYVMLVWRTQLETQWLTYYFPRFGFIAYLIDSAILFMCRIGALVIVAVANRGSLEIPELSRWLLLSATAVIFLWLVYSLLKHFGLKRAAGADHFDPSYRDKPFVRQGIFKYSANAIYLFGALGFYIPALLFTSTAALILALFNHIYIWVHYYCTELPDIRRIYGRD